MPLSDLQSTTVRVPLIAERYWQGQLVSMFEYAAAVQCRTDARQFLCLNIPSQEGCRTRGHYGRPNDYWSRLRHRGVIHAFPIRSA